MQLLVVLAVVAAVAAVAAGYVRGGLAAPTSSLPEVALPEGSLHMEDVAAIRFTVCLRGYRMSEVDDVLDRLGAELAARDAQIARLQEG